jgi:hypothetical protein
VSRYKRSDEERKKERKKLNEGKKRGGQIEF